MSFRNFRFNMIEGKNILSNDYEVFSKSKNGMEKKKILIKYFKGYDKKFKSFVRMNIFKSNIYATIEDDNETIVIEVIVSKY